jgi:helix-turn-helix protein
MTFSKLIHELEALENHLKFTKELTIDDAESIYFVTREAKMMRKRNNEETVYENLELSPTTLQNLIENLTNMINEIDKDQKKHLTPEESKILVYLYKCQRLANLTLLYWTDSE